MPELKPNDQKSGNDESNNHKVIVVGALMVNVDLGWAIFEDQKLDLTVHEYKFLVCLAQNLGRVLTEEELLKQVWECEMGGTKSQVKNLVWRLRQKIEPEPEKPIYVIAARGRGYYMPSNIGTPNFRRSA
jgi:DNA-binding response OmpR family regulator